MQDNKGESMTLAEIENLSFADLKAKRDELVEAAAGVPADKQPEQYLHNLAARYVQARTDAKMRDEKLGEQAATIKALQDGMGALQTKAETASAAVAALKAQLEKEAAESTRKEEALTDAVATERAIIADLQAKLSEAITRGNEATALAKARRTALADVMAFAGQLGAKVSPLLAQE